MLIRPDIPKESKSYLITKSIEIIEDFAHRATSKLIAMSIDKSLSPFEQDHFTKDGLDQLKLIATTPVVSRAYDANCKVLYVIGMIHMLKGFKSDDPQDQDVFYTLFVFTSNADCANNEVVAKVIDLGRSFTSNFDDANNVVRLSHSMIM